MNLYLRNVTENDIDLLYEWANDSEVRRNAFHTEQIPYSTHKAWFAKVLEDNNVMQYILCDKEGTGEIGQIRLELKDNKALISYSIAKDMRGKGFGTKMVLMAEEKLKEAGKDTAFCMAQVKYENTASAKVFEKCGYEAYKKMEYLEYIKQI